MRARLAAATAVSLATLGGGCGASGGHPKTAQTTTSVGSVPAGQQITNGRQTGTVLRQKLHVHKDSTGSDVFIVPSGVCALNDVITGSKARIYGPNEYTAVSPDHSAVVNIAVITSGGGAPASACLKAVKGALGWS